MLPSLQGRKPAWLGSAHGNAAGRHKKGPQASGFLQLRLPGLLQAAPEPSTVFSRHVENWDETGEIGRKPGHGDSNPGFRHSWGSGAPAAGDEMRLAVTHRPAGVPQHQGRKYTFFCPQSGFFSLPALLSQLIVTV